MYYILVPLLYSVLIAIVGFAVLEFADWFESKVKK